MLWILVSAAIACATPAELAGFEITPSRGHQVADLPVNLTLRAVDAAGGTVETFCGSASAQGLHTAEGGAIAAVGPFAAGKATVENARLDSEITVRAGAVVSTWRPAIRQIPGLLSLVPPLLAIVLAVLLRQALLALFAGIWVGAFFVHDYDPFVGLVRTFDTYLPATLVDSGHAAIVIFTMALGGMVGVVSRTGGTRALVEAIGRKAHSRRSGMLTAWASGLVVFFDDYANCLLVGNTVRPFTDELRVSREKLAYIVDSTAAPIATVALVSTWVGYQIGIFEDVFADAAFGVTSGYDLFLRMLPYSFYSFFTIGFVFFIAWSRRDFGPMLAAERRAFRDGHLVRPGGQPLMDRELTDMAPADHSRAHWMTAVVPVVAVIVIVVGGLYVSGVTALGAAAGDAGLRAIISAADSYAVLLWAAFGGSIAAFVMAFATRTASLSEALEAWISGVKAMVIAVLILVLAWGLGAMCQEQLETGPWLLSQIEPNPHTLPVLTFFVSGVIALATGSSFSTMAIVIPIAGPMAWAVTGDANLDAATLESIRYATLAAILSGAVFGDHCSPISDTSIMSSMSAASDHIDHVRTQAPYALVCAAIAALIGFIPAGFGISPLVTVPLGLAACAACVYGLGKSAED